MKARMWSLDILLTRVGMAFPVRKRRNLARLAVYHSIVLGLRPSVWHEREKALMSWSSWTALAFMCVLLIKR